MIADLTIYPSPYSDPALAEYRDTPVTTTVCVPASRLVEHPRPPLPTAEVIATTSIFVIATLIVAMFISRVSSDWVRAHPAQVRSAKRELEAVFGPLRRRPM